MKVNRNFILSSFVVFVLIFTGVFCSQTGYDFSFVFMTDIHVQPEKKAAEGLKKAIDRINVISPDFVITGGDLVMDALAQKFERADNLYKLYDKTMKDLLVPVYNTIGNHEHFGWYEKSGVEPSHPEYGKKMFKNRLGNGKTYFSFAHDGWHFLLLDSVGDTGEGSYYGWIDEEQIEWIKNDLAKVDKSTPVAVSVHIPFITAMTQLIDGSLEANGKGRVINNSKEVLELFKDHNLKLILQGHLHYLEDICVNGVHYITAGAVSARWWNGPRYGVEEGFLLVNVKGEDFDWEYIDYGWEVNN